MLIRIKYKVIKSFITLCFLLMMFVKIYITRKNNISASILAELAGIVFLPTLYFILYGIQARQKIFTTIFIVFMTWLVFYYYYYSVHRRGEFDTLKLEYPALSSQIDNAISQGWDRTKLRQYLAERTKLALTQYTPQEVNQMLGRDENTIRKLVEEIQLQNDNSYVQIMKYDMSENRVKYILNIAKYSGIAPSVLLMSNDLLIRAERIVNENRTIFDKFIDIIDIKNFGIILDLIVLFYFIIFMLVKISLRLYLTYRSKLKIYWRKKSKIFRLVCLINIFWILTILGLTVWLGARLWSDKNYFNERAIINFSWTLFFPLFIVDLAVYCYQRFIK